ncbi:kinesin-like protein Klp59C [Drosophila sechellia]|uniref:Kinesin-like protein n=1 Tax=Drosophila sechellia TaxID=7238 RepID=B4I8H2_DROSE|nr:kinesin-like protein Klp59C [Drosophila sechellia]EDW56897.1 GM15579 [Drosophila sechellia]
MDKLSIEQKIFIRRSDGRVHLAEIIKLEGGDSNLITVEWPEGHTVRGKELPLELVVLMNPHIFDPPRCSGNAPLGNQTASISPRSMKQRIVAGGLLPGLATAAPRQQTKAPAREDEVVHQAERMRQERERRRQAQARSRQDREQGKSEDPGNPNWEIARMIRVQREQMESQPVRSGTTSERVNSNQIMVCVRKRPLRRKELADREQDVVSIPSKHTLVVHEPRKHVNLVKFLENHSFRFDYVFNEDCSNAMVYEYTARPLIKHIFDGGMATCFAYGQTGSGKTHTMGGQFPGRHQSSMDGIYGMAAMDVFATLKTVPYNKLNLKVSCSFFEIYGSRVFDLLMPGKPQLRVLEDSNQQVNVVGLTQNAVQNTDDVLALLELGNSVRTSGHTSANSKSSRSHAVFQIVLRSATEEKLHGKFSLIDLAGNERGADNSSADRVTRLEGSEINKSLLVLKECIRALGRQSSHLPFRGSKLTHVLRDSFIGGKKVKTCMIAMISPCLHSVEHTLNTLRYADRVKELSVDSIFSKRKQDANLGSTSMSDIVSQSPTQQLFPSASSTSLPGGGNQAQQPTNTTNDLSRSQNRTPKSTYPTSGQQLVQRKGRSPQEVSMELAKSLAQFRGRNFP